MTEWKPLTDYIYAPVPETLTSQAIGANDMCMANEDTLYIIGTELHQWTEGEDLISNDDPLLSVYKYDVPNNTLTMYNEDLYTTIETYLASINTTYITGATLVETTKSFINTNGVFPVVTVNISVSADQGAFSTYLIYRIQPDICTLLYSPIDSDDFVIKDYSGTITYVFPYVHVVHKEGGLNIGTIQFECPNYGIYINEPLYDPGSLGGTYYVRQIPINFTTAHFIIINEFGISFNNKFNTASVEVDGDSGNSRYIVNHRYYVRLYFEGEWSSLQGIYSSISSEQDHSSSYSNSSAELFVYPGLTLDTIAAGEISLSYNPPLLYSFGHFLFGRFAFATPGSSASTSSCKEIQAISMYENNVYRIITEINNSSYLNTLQAINYNTYTSTYYGSFFVEGTSMLLSMHSTRYPNGTFGYVTFYGPDNIYLDQIDKYNTSPYPSNGYKRGYFTGNNYKIYRIDQSYATPYMNGGARIAYVPWIPSREAKPTSISTTETSIFIGGSTDHPTVLGVYFEDGEPSEETTIPGFTEDPIFIEIELPETLSEFSEANDYFEVVSLAGYSYVKNYNEECLLHGKLNLYNALLLSKDTWQDISAGLPAGISTSVDFSAAMNIYLSINVGEVGYVYKWTGEGAWTKVDEIATENISTAHIISLDDVFLAGHDGSSPEVERTNINLIDVQPSNTSLPSGVYITDIEEDIWNDR